MKSILKKLSYILLIPLVVITLLLFPTQKSDAATLTAAYITLTRMQAGLDATANLEIYIAFAPSGAVDASTITLQFPDGDDATWCRTAGTDLTVAGVTSTPADSTGNYVVDAALPGTLAASCTQGTGLSSVDTITITGATALTAGTTYGVKVSNSGDLGTAKLGTAATAGQKVVTLTVNDGTDPETKSFGINLVTNDQVAISATVVDVQTVTCTIGSNSVNLGNLYKGGSYVTGSHTITTSTSSSAGGYYWSVYGTGDGTTDAGLYKSTATTYLIASNNANPTVDISAPGSEGFGMNTSVPTGAVGGTGFSGNSAGVFGSVGLNASEAELLLYQIGAQATSEDATITYGARAGASAEAGTYSETITFICGGYY
jgi:hypothetical protein